MGSTNFKQKLRAKILSYKPDFDLDVLQKGLDLFRARIKAERLKKEES